MFTSVTSHAPGDGMGQNGGLFRIFCHYWILFPGGGGASMFHPNVLFENIFIMFRPLSAHGMGAWNKDVLPNTESRQ